MNHIFCIEGCDNVGKTTLINNIKLSEYIDKINCNNFSFVKYPTSDITKFMDTYNAKLKTIDLVYKNGDISPYDHRVSRDNLIYSIIRTNIDDMKEIFNNNKLDKVIISDRGPLSTYLYQYRNLTGIDSIPKLDISKERLYLYNFFEHCVPHINTDFNIIILNNNSNEKMPEDTKETIAYKKAFDKDTLLQDRIKGSLENILQLKNIGVEPELGIKIHQVDIWKEDIRKTPEEVCEEVIDLINSRI